MIFVWILVFAAAVVTACALIVRRRERREVPDDATAPSGPAAADRSAYRPTSVELEAQARLEADRRFYI